MSKQGFRDILELDRTGPGLSKSTDLCASLLQKNRSIFVLSIDFSGVNVPTMAAVKLQMCCDVNPSENEELETPRMHL